MNIQQLIEVGREHLKLHLPKFFRDLEIAGAIDSHLDSAARRTRSEMDSLVMAGYSEDEAWQMTRERYLILRPDEDEEDTASEGNERTRGIFETMREMTELQHSIDEYDDEPPDDPTR